MRESIHRSKQKETYQQAAKQEEKVSGIPNSSLEAVMAGKTRASSEMMGHRQDLAPSLAAKMSKAFGMDLSQMQVYRSGAMQGTGMQGMASGNKIVLSKDIDLNTTAGQAVLGHEISHVHAQSQGIGMGHSGLYDNASLEHQADVEGMMAARGQSILGERSGMETGLGMGGIGGLTPLSPGMSASAGAPMQASLKNKTNKKSDTGTKGSVSRSKKKKAPKQKEVSKETGGKVSNRSEEEELKRWMIPDSPKLQAMEQKASEQPQSDPNASWEDVVNGVQWKTDEKEESFADYASTNRFASVGEWGLNGIAGPGDDFTKKWKNNDKLKEAGINLSSDRIAGAIMERVIEEYGVQGGDVAADESMETLINGMVAAKKTRKEANAKNRKVGQGDITDDELKARKQAKEIYYEELLRREKKWGKLLHQMDLKDILKRGGQKGFGADLNYCNVISDMNLVSKENDYATKFEDEKREARFQRLHNYFHKLHTYLEMVQFGPEASSESLEEFKKAQKWTDENNVEHDVIENGPSFSPEQLEEYKKRKEE